MNAAEKARLARELAEKEELEQKEQDEKLKLEQQDINNTNDEIKEITNNLKVGSIVKFGRYPQTHKEDPIEWIVIDSNCEEVKLLSKSILDCCEFHSELTGTSRFGYDISVLRDFLNEEFLNRAFTKKEQDKIKRCKLDSKFDETKLARTCTTEDKVYLLSEYDISNMKKKFLKTQLTDYAKTKGKKPRWWIRDVSAEWVPIKKTTEKTLCLTAIYYLKGKRNQIVLQSPITTKVNGVNVRNEPELKQDFKTYGVRPAITIILD